MTEGQSGIDNGGWTIANWQRATTFYTTAIGKVGSAWGVVGHN